jgi:hypothetical protein
MKTLTALLIVLFALHLCSCQKDNGSTIHRKIANASLFGDWKLAGNYISSGGPQYFVPAKVKSNATFNTDGGLTGTSFPTYNRYTLVDSVTIKLTGAGTDYTTFLYKINEDTLRMSPIAPYICIEGCSIVFVK